MKRILHIFWNSVSILIAIFLLSLVLIFSIPQSRSLALGVIGWNLTLFGHNQIGPKISEFGLSEKPKVSGEDLRRFSVQNSKNGNYGIAIKALDSAIRLDPQVQGYYGWLMLYYYKDYDRALRLLNGYDALTPAHYDVAMGEDVPYLKALALQGMGKTSQAIDAYHDYICQIVAEHDSSWLSVYALVNMGRAYLELNSDSLALQQFDAALALCKNCPEAHYFKALTLFRMQAYSAAHVYIHEAARLIRAGHLHSDPYVELPEAVYHTQVTALREQIKQHVEGG